MYQVRESSPYQEMRVLFVSKNFPVDFSTRVHGVIQRLRMFLDAIKRIGQVDALFYVQDDIDVSPSSIAKIEHSFSKYWNADIRLFLCKRFDHKRPVLKWKNYGSKMIGFFNQTGFLGTSGPEQVKAFEACLRNKPDKIFVHRLRSMGPLLKTNEALPDVYLDLDDIEHLAFMRGIRQRPEWYKRLLNYAMLPSLCWSEYKAIQLAHRTFVCSDKDRNYLTNRWALKGVVKVPNAVRIPKAQPITHEQTLLFLGSYFHNPNIYAVEFLIKQVWPRIYEELPTAQLIIAGTPENNIPAYGAGISGVTFTGFVKDLEDLYRRSRVVCAPIVSGGGTRVKVIEAAAYGKPIVSTRIGAEGLQMRDDHDIVIRDDPKLFAQACIKLLTDRQACDRLGNAARATVVKQYDRAKVQGLIQEIITESF